MLKWKEIKSIIPDDVLLKTRMLQYDVNNIKILLKSELAEQEGV